MPLASHIQLPERYRVMRHIASGGMASVWEVEDLLLGRVVAVKVLGAQFAADRGARERFQREARTAARVCDHPNIATIYDIGEHQEEAFIVMELFSGGTVADRVRAAGDDGGKRVPRETALRWLREAAGGLDWAHAAGIIHRDVKPANLLIDGQDRLAVGDFGIARLADDTSMTQTGMLLGTAAYLSPEQALGGQATAASDRYAFAVVAFELLTGERPFAGGPPVAQVRQHAEAQPVRASEAAPDLPPAIDAVLARGLSKEPGDRPGSAADLVGEIDRALRSPEPTEPTRKLKPVVPIVPVAAPIIADLPRRPPAGAPAAPPPRQPRKTSALVPIGIAAAAVGAVIAIVLSGGGDNDRRAASSTPRTSQAASGRTQTTAAPAAAQPAKTEPAPGGATKDPAALNDQGFALNQRGEYAEAIPLLRSSVEGYRSAGRTKELGYAFALFNLAVALNRSGDPASAVDLLRERLTYPNQPGPVRRELNDALAKLDGAGARKSKPGKGNRGDDGD